MNLCLLFGGKTYEHEISIVSAIALKKLFSHLHFFIFLDDNHHFYLIPANKMQSKLFSSKDYKKEKYRKAHPYVFIDLEDGSHCYEIFSCHNAPVTDISYTIGYKKDQTYAAFLEELKASSLYDTGVAVGAEDSVITLSTYIDNKKDRFVVHARKIY